MTDLVIPLTSVSIQQAKSSTKFGSLAILPVSGVTNAISRQLLRGALSAIPAGATVTSAVVVVPQYPAYATPHTLVLQQLTSAFSTATTFTSRPSFTATGQVSVTATLPAGGLYSFDVTTLVQAFVSGASAYYGFQVTTAETVVLKLRGASSSSLRPELRVTYITAAQVPSALNPSGGSVSKNKPTLTAQVGLDTTAIQVQVDPAQNVVTPGFDSGILPFTAGLLDLSTTAYAGLADLATTYHRWQVRNGLGWSGWSSWVPFTRTAWKTLAITSPGATSEDPSPTVQATYTGGTITAYQVEAFDATGKSVELSQWIPSATVSYGLTKSVGASGSVTVRIRDNVNRVVTPGDPDFLSASQAFTVTPSGTPPTITALSATGKFPRPWVGLTGTRASIPDEVVIYRNGTLVGRVTGASVFTGTAFAWTDYTAPPNASASYTVQAVVAGAWSAASAASVVTPTCSGIWFANQDDGTEAVIWGNDDQEQSQPEVAIEHQPLRDGAGIVRRRMMRGLRQGAVAGTLLDASYGTTYAASLAALEAWAELDAGQNYRAVMGNRNIPVLLGNILIAERSDNSLTQKLVTASLSWWAQ